jgi:hypothetical protein
MSTEVSQPALPGQVRPHGELEVTVYAHSNLFYWWPVWAVGYAMALLTYLRGYHVQVGDAQVLMHPSKNLGVIYTIVFLLVLLMTNASLRGLASALLIVTVLALTFLFAYLDWWGRILEAVGRLAVFMNLGFYFFFSTAVFLAWLLAVFFFDRMEHWSFRPGQMVHGQTLGEGAQTYDTQGMSVNKLRYDLFRHWVLGLGSGDILVSTTGARQKEFTIPNVLFVGTKLARIERLVAMRPREAADLMGVPPPPAT